MKRLESRLGRTTTGQRWLSMMTRLEEMIHVHVVVERSTRSAVESSLQAYLTKKHKKIKKGELKK